MSSLSLFVQLRVPSCKRAVLWDVFFPLAAEGLTMIAAAALTLPSPWGPSFRSPGVFGLPVRISYDCQITSN